MLATSDQSERGWHESYTMNESRRGMLIVAIVIVVVGALVWILVG